MKQRQLLAEFLSNMAIAVLTVGTIAPLFTLQKFDKEVIIKFSLSFLTGLILMVTSLKTVE